MDRIVVAFGGSTIAPEDLNPDYLANVANHLLAWAKTCNLFVVIGGGNPARRYINAARHLHVREDGLDRIGIQATRLNAQLMATVLEERGVAVNTDIPHRVEDAVAEHERLDGDAPTIVFMGGTTPGHSTDYVAAELAIAAGAKRLIIATNVDGVYTKDPRTNPDAHHKPTLNFDELLEIIAEGEWTTAGAPGVIDGPASRLIARHGLTTAVVEGHNLDNMAEAMAGRAFHGTAISGEAVVVA